jgi:hypothetical protein
LFLPRSRREGEPNVAVLSELLSLQPQLEFSGFVGRCGEKEDIADRRSIPRYLLLVG